MLIMLFDVWIGVEKHTFKANQWTCPNDWIEITGVLGDEMEKPEPSGLFLRSMKTTQAGCLGKAVWLKVVGMVELREQWGLDGGVWSWVLDSLVLVGSTSVFYVDAHSLPSSSAPC